MSSRIDIKNIEKLVDRYFSGDTDPAEERLLRKLLSETDCENEKLREAIAVMGFFSMQKAMVGENADTVRYQGYTKTPRRLGVAKAAVAAAAGLLLVVAGLSLLCPTRISNQCEIYIAGVRSTETDEGLAVMESQFTMVSEAIDYIDIDMATEICNFAEKLQ